MKQTLLPPAEILVGYDAISRLYPYIPSMIIWRARVTPPADAPVCLSPFSMSAATVAVFFGSPALISKGDGR
jgi:hypothetical protein